MIHDDRYWERYWQRMRKASDRSREREQLLAEAIVEIIEECGPLTHDEIARRLRDRGWCASPNTAKYSLSHCLAGRVSQAEAGRWSLGS